ncbi:Uu.00g022380.m01.CDS01 [Anthostomella pinea]|uniref:Uu.00g022380.m01.CDS01 n=1 Tax=Anthostomella pinea TaxID=933095 RepID=A0AAI8YQV3_9PEZI|nr:Uu.00g022380.m01.CDS01 [Anthostomella pinea]
MRYAVPLLSAATIALARVDIMLPLYTPPGAPLLPGHKPFNGPTNSSDLGFTLPPTLRYSTPCPTPRPIGYVSTAYATGVRNRTEAAIKADIDNWASWQTQTSWSGPGANISINGIWFDETSGDAADFAFYQRLTAHAGQAFAGRQYITVLNIGVRMDAAYERQMFDLASAVVTRETCWQEPSTANAVECPPTYTPFDAATLQNSSGLPVNADLYPKASVIVHYVQPPRELDGAMLAEQIRQTVAYGFHSAYFTSAKLWETTTLGPATVGAVAQAMADAQV